MKKEILIPVLTTHQRRLVAIQLGYTLDKLADIIESGRISDKVWSAIRELRNSQEFYN